MVGLVQDPLELENRKRIFEVLRASPGLHFREIQRRTNISIGVLEYHLSYLVDRGLLTLERQGAFARYYPAGQVGAEKKKMLSALRQEIPRGIILYLLKHPGATHGEVLQNFTISGGTLSYHVKKLVDQGVIKLEKAGRESRMTVLDPDKVADLLILYRRTFFDKLVDEFVSMYIERGAHQQRGVPETPGGDQPPK